VFSLVREKDIKPKRVLNIYLSAKMKFNIHSK